MGICAAERFTVLLVCLWIDIDRSKFQPRGVSHREAVRRAHRAPSLSFTNVYFFSCVETYEAKTARAGSSAICAGTLVSLCAERCVTRDTTAKCTVSL